jgi:hypothetical protein
LLTLDIDYLDCGIHELPETLLLLDASPVWLGISTHLAVGARLPFFFTQFCVDF